LAKADKSYVEFNVDGEVLFRTRTSEETANPQWAESFDRFMSDMASSEIIIYVKRLSARMPTPSDFILAHWRGDLNVAALGKSNVWITLQNYPLKETPIDALATVGSMMLSLAFSPVRLDVDISQKFSKSSTNPLII
jgi:hypothetical protein